jgi:hypothetical protein
MERRQFLFWSGSTPTASLAGCAGEADDADDAGGGSGGGDGGDSGGGEPNSPPEPVEYSGAGAATRDELEIRGGLTVVEAVRST